MDESMRFPDTVEEFMEQYKVVDREGIYMSKGSKLVPIFRMDQWFEHEKEQLSQEGTTKGTTSNLIGRQAAVELAMKYCPDDDGAVQCDGDIRELLDELENLPPAQPEQKTATWLIRKWGDDAKCSNCGHAFKDVYDMDNHDRFCRFCGRKMIGVKGVNT